MGVRRTGDGPAARNCGEARAHLRRYAGAIPALHRSRSGKKGMARNLGERRSCCGGWQGLEGHGVAGPWWRGEVCAAEQGERARLGFVGKWSGDRV